MDEEPEYGGRRHLEKQDFILAKQKEELTKQSSQIQSQENFIQSQKKSIQSQSEVMYQQRKALQSQQSQIEEQDVAIQEKEEKLDELTLKIDDVEALIDEVSDISYDKAVEVVTDTVRVETHKHDMKLVEQSKAWVLSPERKASQKEKEYAAARLDGVITKIKNSMQTALKTIHSTLMKPEVRKVNTEQISQKARSSILDKLHKKQADVARREAEKRKTQPNKKYDIEI